MLIKRPTHQLLKQRGDTIVEVLISITVISLILGGAYVTTNKSLISTRSSQERVNGLKLVESQIEQLKGVVAANPSAVFGGAVPSPFCLYTDPATHVTNVFASSNANCVVSTSGVPTTAEPKFSLSVTRSTNTFTIKNSWKDLSGNVTDQIQMTYRVYQ